jgi:hypothetical protein
MEDEKFATSITSPKRSDGYTELIQVTCQVFATAGMRENKSFIVQQHSR